MLWGNSKMIPYVCAFTGSCLSSLSYSFAKDISLRFISWVCLFSFLFFPLAFRYKIGTDYANYTQILETAFMFGYIPSFEIGWYPIIVFIKFFHLDLQFFFIIPAFFSVLIFLYVVPPKKILFCLPVFFCFSWINSFNIVRQAFASMIFLLSLNCYQKNHFIRALFWGIIAFCFHKSAFLLCFLLIAAHFIRTVKNTYFNVSVFIIIILVFVVGKIGFRLFNAFAGYTPYAVYLNSEFSKQANLGSGLGVLLKEFILLLFLLSTQDGNDENFNKENNIVRIFVFMMGMAIALSAQIRILGRMANLFDAIYVYLIVHMTFASLRLRKIYLIFIFLIASLLFFKTVVGSPSSARSGLGVFPYQSIFSR